MPRLTRTRAALARRAPHPAGSIAPDGGPGQGARTRGESTIVYDRPAQTPGSARTSVDHPDKARSWAFAEEFVAEDEPLLRARELATELGCPCVQPGAGAVLRLVAAATAARAVVEVGTGTGVGSLWLLRGMPTDGVLTTIDAEVGHQRAAKELLAGAGISPKRLRAIAGRPADVLPRLADATYDLVVVGGDVRAYASVVTEALRMLRPGGVLAVDGALAHDRVPDPARRDEITTLVREVGRRLRDDERLLPALVPSGDGLLLAVRAA